MKTSDLLPYIGNARTHAKEQVNLIAASIKEFGFNNPILIDGKNGIIAGHGRLEAAKKLGLTEVPVIELSHLSDAQKRAYILADNRLALDAGWDDSILSAELKRLTEDEFDLSLTGFSKEELDKLLGADAPVVGLTDEDEVPEQAPAVCQRGQIWLLGKHRLMCGDSTSEAYVAKLMDGQKADLLFTDPTYGISVVKNGKIGSSKLAKTKSYKEIEGDNSVEVSHLALAVGRNVTAQAVIWGGNYFTDVLPPSRCWYIWDKQNGSNNFADAELAWCSLDTSVRLFKWLWNGMSRKGDHKDEGATRVHPTQKPVGLFALMFEEIEFKTCLDLFGGSGSTLIACEKTNRVCFMMELDEHYCDVIIARWEKYTGKKAELCEAV